MQSDAMDLALLFEFLEFNHKRFETRERSVQKKKNV